MTVQGVPAVGNVGQLGIDLLILRAAAKRCAILESPDVLPVAGRGALTERQGAHTDQGPKEGLVTALEVFRVEHQGVKCFFLQQRGPVVTGRCSVYDSCRKNSEHPCLCSSYLSSVRPVVVQVMIVPTEWLLAHDTQAFAHRTVYAPQFSLHLAYSHNKGTVLSFKISKC